jgi:ZIP family zinc transporter
MPQLLSILLFALIPVIAVLIGATYAAFVPPGRVLRSTIQHFAAGVVFSVVAVELLPGVRQGHDPLEVGWTFAAGVAVMLLLQAFGKRLEAADAAKGTEDAPSVGSFAAIGIDVLIDGLLIGIAFAAGSKEGLLLTLALTLEMLSLGLSMAVELRQLKRWQIIALPTAVAMLLLVGALVGGTVLRGASTHTLAGVLSFGCAALLYLVVEELMVEAHENAETPMATAMFFVGFLIFLLLGMVV